MEEEGKNEIATGQTLEPLYFFNFLKWRIGYKSINMTKLQNPILLFVYAAFQPLSTDLWDTHPPSWLWLIVVGPLLRLIWLFATPWTAALQAPLSMGFPRWDYWSGLPFPSPGNLSHSWTEPTSPALAGRFLTNESPGKLFSWCLC